MNDKDTLRAAVELAEGWEHHTDPSGELWLAPEGVHRPHVNGSSLWIWDELPAPILDALAAQLVRQVDALDGYFIEVSKGWACVREALSYEAVSDVNAKYGPDRTLNTIKAIVDSGVLK